MDQMLGEQKQSREFSRGAHSTVSKYCNLSHVKYQSAVNFIKHRGYAQVGGGQEHISP